MPSEIPYSTVLRERSVQINCCDNGFGGEQRQGGVRRTVAQVHTTGKAIRREGL